MSSRSFITKGAWKKSVPIVLMFLALAIGFHYNITIDRMNKVEAVFNDNQAIICENRKIRKIAQSIIIEKQRGWILKDHILTSPKYNRGFYTARCLIQINI